MAVVATALRVLCVRSPTDPAIAAMTIFCSRTGEPDPFADGHEDHVHLDPILMHIPKRRLNDNVVDGPPMRLPLGQLFL